MTDAELIDKILAGLTPQEEHMLSIWKDECMSMSMQFVQLHDIFEKLHADKRRTAASINDLIQKVCDEPFRSKFRGLSRILARCYDAYCQHGRDCQNIHERLYWTGHTKYMPIEFLTTLYNRWLEEQQAKSQSA